MILQFHMWQLNTIPQKPDRSFIIDNSTKFINTTVWKFLPIYLSSYSWQHINESKVLHTYVMNEFWTASCSIQTKYFWNEVLLKLIPITFTLISVPFESKLVKYSTCCQSLKTPRKLLIHCFWSENGTKVELLRAFKHSLQL